MLPRNVDSLLTNIPPDETTKIRVNVLQKANDYVKGLGESLFFDCKRKQFHLIRPFTDK